MPGASTAMGLAGTTKTRAAANHPQMATRNMLRSLDYPFAENVPTKATAPHFSHSLTKVGRPPPYLGEHNRAVLRRFLRISDKEIEGLHEGDVLYEHERVPVLAAGRGVTQTRAPSRRKSEI